MRIHRVRGRSLSEALERARTAHGDNALVLSQESSKDGDVWLAVAERGTARARVFPKAEVEAKPSARPLDPGALDALGRLERSGASNDLRERVRLALEASDARGAFAIDAAAAELGRAIAVAPSPRVDGRLRALAFVGPTGVGKTTSLAKLASRLVRAGRRVALVTTDTFRVGALEQLQAYGALLQAPVSVAQDGAELASVVAASAQFDALLIDTTGRSPADTAALGGLAQALEAARVRAHVETYLVLAASASREALGLAAEAFRSVRPDATILTKLDETRAPAPAVEVGSACGAGLLFLCDGPDVSRHLERAQTERCADLLLRGRLS